MELLHVTRAVVYGYVKSGKLQAKQKLYAKGRPLLIDKASVDKFISEGTIDVTSRL